MFSDVIRESFKAQAAAMEQQANNEAERTYLQAAKDWAINKARGVVAPPPVPAKAVKAVVSFEGNFSLTFIETADPVSSIAPESFLPTFGTDINAVGGPIGGPIPDQPGHFYAASNVMPYIGQFAEVSGRRFLYTGTTPWNKFWQELP